LTLAGLACFVSSLGMSHTAVAGQVDSALAASVRLSPHGVMRVIVQLDGEKPMGTYLPALQSLPRSARPGKLKSLMLADYQTIAQKIAPKLAAINAREVHALWLTHSMLVEVPRNQVTTLAALPGVKQVGADLSLRSAQRSGINMLPLAKERALAEAAAAAGKPAPTPKKVAPSRPYHSATDALASGEPLSLPAHYLAMDVPAAWQSGARGKGVTVAIVDSGVDPRSTAIAQGYRARPGDWFDPYGERTAPTDIEGHGTYVAGLLVGDVVSSNTEPVESVPTGVAPEAKWIAARIFDDGGRGSISAIQRIYQWVLDPDGKPETADAPDIVNNSWGLPQTAGHCDLTMSRAIDALRAADIHVVFAAGNDGPNDNTSLSPANNPGVISVGALQGNGEASRRSSRGPSACGNAAYPTLWTAGENLPALDRLQAL
jgi:subtilisin family serine protease